ncbi:hypothetical protein EJ110_NYTH58951, partial [Nymphaea thermarum]
IFPGRCCPILAREASLAELGLKFTAFFSFFQARRIIPSKMRKIVGCSRHPTLLDCCWVRIQAAPTLASMRVNIELSV